MSTRTERLAALAKQVRCGILEATTAAGSGHPTSSLSATDLLVTLFFGGWFQARIHQPQYPNNDRLVLSKGHAAPLLYSLYAAAGAVRPVELKKLRRLHSRLEGHPAAVFPYTDVPTGSLGQGLAIGAGMALSGKLQRLPFRTFVLLGDSELTEGSVWEAAEFAAYRRLDNLIAIVDVNRLGQSGPTMAGYRLDVVARRWQAFGWSVIKVDGHDLKALMHAYRAAVWSRGRPAVILAKTIKGQGVSWLENRSGWHGKALSPAQLNTALKALGAPSGLTGKLAAPAKRQPRRVPVGKHPNVPAFNPAASPREAFGQALVTLGRRNPRLVVLDGEVKNSTMTEYFAKAFPSRFIECYIAEQLMVGVAQGLAARGFVPLAATFAAFFTRAHDQLRMGQGFVAHRILAGTHVGVHVGPDGASQMGLDDIAMFRGFPGTSILYPSDAYSAASLTKLAVVTPGKHYLRLTRAALPPLYGRGDVLRVGGSQVLRRHPKDSVTVVAAGVTLHEALAAADLARAKGIYVRVIDAYSVEPLDIKTIRTAARATGRVMTVEDHRPAGGLGDAVRSALSGADVPVESLAVLGQPTSGQPDELLRQARIDRRAILQSILSGRR